VDADRWEEVSSLFAAALERAPGERSALLGDIADPGLRHEVESLLAAHEAVGPLDRMAARMDTLRGDALASVGSGATGGTVRETPPALEPGRRLGRHEIRARVGTGGMGEVYRALDTRLQRDVAIKVLGGRGRQRPDALHRFEEEARAASALNHPNIITVYDIGEEAGHPYIVMELLEGESLRQMLGGPWPVEPLLRLAVQIADGLVAAHERQIVHRDLKPENVLVTPAGTPKILDFGLAQFQMERAPLEPGATPDPRVPPRPLLGTVGYVAPELVSGEPGDHRADQFSLGAILYEMAAGVPCFPGGSPLERLAQSVRTEPPPLDHRRPDLPAPFLRAVERCLRKDPGDRYDSTRDLLEDVRTAQQERSPLAPPGTGRRALALPAQRTRLIGRQRELEEIQRLVLEKGVRLLTLTGTGGTGKTRLALEAAERLSPHFPGGVFFVPLAAFHDPRLVAAAIAQAMGAARSSLAAVVADLRVADAPTLLLLDNFEQVLDAAPAVSELLAACRHLAVMVTSREVLHVYGEHGVPVLPLDLPDPAHLPSPEALAECAAVALFVERAQAANPGFRLTAANAPAVAELCTRLDGLPLPLELAAAQTRLLPPAAMLSRLDDRLRLLTGGARDLPDRQQTLRRTLDWSHQLLDPTEQAVFRRLGVFVGGFTLEAAQAVADPYGRLEVSLEQGVGALVNKSLLQARETADGEPRFFMLETLREYAQEKLAAEGEDEKTRRAHAAYLLVLAEEGAAGIASAQGPDWLKRFATEHDNLRAALDWLIRRKDAEWGLRLGWALFHFWERAEHIIEARRRLGALLELPGVQAFPAARARALFAAGVFAFDQGDVDEGWRLHSQCLEIYRELDDRAGIVVVLVGLGAHYSGRGEYDRARGVLEESLRLWEELGDQAGYARSVSNLAYVARGQGRYDEARALYRQAAAMFEGLGDRSSRAWAADHEGDVAREQGDLDAAEALYRGALETFRSLEDPWGIASSLADLGIVARQRGDRESAGRSCREALAGFARLDHRRGIARLLESLACLAAEAHDPTRGLQLAAAAAVLRERIGAPATAGVRADLDRSVEAMRQALGADAARRAWQEGAALSLEGALRLAEGGTGVSS
jgi:predicted ATPase